MLIIMFYIPETDFIDLSAQDKWYSPEQTKNKEEQELDISHKQFLKEVNARLLKHERSVKSNCLATWALFNFCLLRG